MFKNVIVTISHDKISTSEFSELRERFNNWLTHHNIDVFGTTVYQNCGLNLKLNTRTMAYESDPQSLSARTLLCNVDSQDYLDLFMEFKCKEKKYADNFDLNLNPFSQSN